MIARELRIHSFASPMSQNYQFDTDLYRRNRSEAELSKKIVELQLVCGSLTAAGLTGPGTYLLVSVVVSTLKNELSKKNVCVVSTFLTY